MKKASVPYGWESYLAQIPYKPEVLPDTLFDTQFYKSEETTRLDFFVKPHPFHSNMYDYGVLPSTCAFLIESIRIHGITSRIQFGCGRLQIGNKYYGCHPAWSFGMKEKGFKCRPSLMIPALTSFRFVLDWEVSEKIGRGLNGQEISAHPIQVVFFGQMARAIQ